MNQSTSIISGEPGAEDPDDAPDVAPQVEMRELLLAADAHGWRLDRAMVQALPEFSRSYLQQLIESDGVRVNDVLVRKPAARVRCGARCQVELRATAQSLAFRPEPMQLQVVFEDQHLLVVNKPAGLVVHPAPGNWSGTLLNGLLARNAGAAQLPRAGIVHRLDKDTSGLMVVAQTRAVMAALVQRIAARSVTRQYYALAHRPWSGPVAREIATPIGRDPRNRLRMAVVDLARNSGKTAKTGFELLDNAPDGCWLRCSLHTGRTHQIRVHLASIGHPLVADALYGGVALAGMSRQALHAYRLAFVHPVTGAALDLQAPLPLDMLLLLQSWGLSYNQP